MPLQNLNVTLITNGFHLLLKVFVKYISQELMTEYGNEWWRTGVLERLRPEQQRNLPQEGKDDTLVNSLDIYLCLLLFDLYWNEIFRKKLSIDHRTWAKELIGVRNRLAHIGSEDFNDNDTWRALDTMSRLCEQLDAEKAEEIRSILRQARYGSEHGSTSRVTNGNAAPQPEQQTIRNLSGLPSWRDVIEPHPDVAQGRYRNAEFAADLAQVARGDGAFEYLDPVEFFARTYVTEGMKELLTEALLRVLRKGGEPVIQLKTAFGGGKTHSMLGLYHLLRGKAPLEKIPSIKPLLEAIGTSTLPAAHVAVLVGTALDPSRSKRPANLPGITVNTLWGELAYQLALSTGKPQLYDFVKEADKKGISPGSEALTRLFDAAGSCLVLMDELVAYAKRIHGVDGLPAGSFDNFITFVQEISEAARASKSSLVVASIPESDIEVGGEAGQKALEAIEHTFGRMESIWKPVAANEGFEVVRRRLFLDCKNPAARDMVCAKFGEMYNENPADFPIEAREMEYRKRLAACYPIHPEIFDRLYEDWATLERFQRTRGVLRLMAAVIHELWMTNDQSVLIQPGSLPLDVPAVRDELTRHLQETWNGIVEREVDGKRSVPFQQDQKNSRYGKLLGSRRMARAIMLGSAPTVKQQKVRGIEASRIRLGAIQPGEQISVFNDALNTLQNNLAYLYSNPSSNRFWYDTRPTLRKTVEDRASQIAAVDVEYEIEKRLKARCKKESPLSGVHVCPASSLDVPDEQSVRLVILRPSESYSPQKVDCPAMKSVEDILGNRGTAPRTHKNMLVFLAPDKNSLQALEQETRRYLAWASIKNDSQDLNLDAAQNRETDVSLKRSGETVDYRLAEAWCWLLVPTADRNELNKLEWQAARLSGASEGIISRTIKKLLQDEAIVNKWAPALLLMELNDLLWRDKDSLEIKTLWEYLTTYCYLPRLATYEVLASAIRSGVENSDQYFAYAAGSSEGRFIDLKYNQRVEVEKSGYLVKKDAAQKQIEADAAEKAKKLAEQSTGPADFGQFAHNEPARQNEATVTSGEGTPSETITPQESPRPKRFFLNTHLDATRINRDVSKIMDEVLKYVSCEGTLEIRLEVQAESQEGFDQQTVRAASENCKILRIDTFGFEKG